MNVSKLRNTRLYKTTQLLALYQNHYSTFMSSFEKSQHNAIAGRDGVSSEKMTRIEHFNCDMAYATRPKSARARFLCGEDALFIGPNKDNSTLLFSVFDGVGGYSQLGVDPAEYSNLMADSCRIAFEENSKTDLRDVLERAYARAVSWGTQGGTTAVLAKYDPSSNQMEILNLGDSKALHFSKDAEGKYALLDETSEQEHFFNCPFQLSSEQSDKPNVADAKMFSISTGDIIVLATDGITDNLSVEEMLRIINEKRAACTDESTFARDCSEALTKRATEIARNPKAKTPFQIRSKGRFEGGKMDDITNVLCYIRKEAV
eukprot:CAMPEP_0117439890 /NCGR_PEP_ID=MMETSP0759-20121206/2794_1 /TAXON_ID=63605 /ORGANISM="Percolomonas cosmopolitus, Strain WS" /LENGTH=317 /DNA_ID=CAMNT_0005231611 /DNA_START=464 /DNA_END=1417 /DNA_ORIENTATION=-